MIIAGFSCYDANRRDEVVARQHVRLSVRKNLREILRAKNVPFALTRLEKQQHNCR